jgi:hypothetical protein
MTTKLPEHSAMPRPSAPPMVAVTDAPQAQKPFLDRAYSYVVPNLKQDWKGKWSKDKLSTVTDAIVEFLKSIAFVCGGFIVYLVKEGQNQKAIYDLPKSLEMRLKNRLVTKILIENEHVKRDSGGDPKWNGAKAQKAVRDVRRASKAYTTHLLGTGHSTDEVYAKLQEVGRDERLDLPVITGTERSDDDKPYHTFSDSLGTVAMKEILEASSDVVFRSHSDQMIAAAKDDKFRPYSDSFIDDAISITRFMQPQRADHRRPFQISYPTQTKTQNQLFARAKASLDPKALAKSRERFLDRLQKPEDYIIRPEAIFVSRKREIAKDLVTHRKELEAAKKAKAKAKEAFAPFETAFIKDIRKATDIAQFQKDAAKVIKLRNAVQKTSTRAKQLEGSIDVLEHEEAKLSPLIEEALRFDTFDLELAVSKDAKSTLHMIDSMIGGKLASLRAYALPKRPAPVVLEAVEEPSAPPAVLPLTGTGPS